MTGEIYFQKCSYLLDGADNSSIFGGFGINKN